MTKLRPPQLMVLLDLRDRGQSPHSQAEDAIALASSVIYALTAEAVDTGLVAEGAACPTFEPRHSWWHRTQVLHALAEVDLDGPTTNPNIRTVKDAGSWLVIHAGPVDRSFGPEGAVHMTSQATHQYLNENEPEAAPGPVGTLIRNDHRPRYAEREEAAWA